MDKTKALRGARLARYFDPDVPYHVFAKTLRGQFLLRPEPEVNEVIVGVLARARHNWPEVRLYAVSVMSNHFHMVVRGQSKHLSAFVGLFMREVSRRLGKIFSEPGTYWHGRFSATALPTPESQETCLKYILSNSVKEDLVHRCRDWPGVHSASALADGEVLQGVWFDGTAFCRAKHRGVHLQREEFCRTVWLELDVPECWSELGPSERRARAGELIDEVEHEAAERRRHSRARVLGAASVRTISRRARVLPEAPSWLRPRRRLKYVWADPNHDSVKRFIAGYWSFQNAYRTSSDLWRESKPPNFPSGSWTPARAVC